MKTTNIKCRKQVNDLVGFKGNNLYSVKGGGDFYVVYSYGLHFPLYLHKDGIWYENSDKYSVTTSKHKSQARPNADTVLKTTKELKAMI